VGGILVGDTEVGGAPDGVGDGEGCIVVGVTDGVGGAVGGNVVGVTDGVGMGVGGGLTWKMLICPLIYPNPSAIELNILTGLFA
jgi:hypothetical protein